MLRYSKQFVKEECGENEKTYPLFHLLDSLIDTSNISEEDFRKALNKSVVIFRQQGNLIAVIELYLYITSNYKQIVNPSVEQMKSLALFYIPLYRLTFRFPMLTKKTGNQQG
ncbi:MAG: hypothetical protein LBE04_02950 [Prevotellaceae bacterium]|nr:hypothetical protein [Prevotellaceae bacterium]